MKNDRNIEILGQYYGALHSLNYVLYLINHTLIYGELWINDLI